MSWANERVMGEPAAIVPRLQRALAVKAVRQSLFAAACVLLVAILGYLYHKTQGVDIKRASEVLGALRDLKEIDARWDAEILRLRAEPIPAQPAPPADHPGPTLERVRKDLAAAASALRSPLLARS